MGTHPCKTHPRESFESELQTKNLGAQTQSWEHDCKRDGESKRLIIEKEAEGTVNKRT